MTATRTPPGGATQSSVHRVAFTKQDNLRRMMVMAVINFRQTCTKCGGRAERIITLFSQF